MHTCIGGSNGYKGQEALDVRPGTAYIFSFWVKGNFPQCVVSIQGWKKDDYSPKGRISVRPQLFKDGKPVTTITPADKWEQYTGEFTTEADMTKAAVKVGSTAFADDKPAFLYIDDAAVKEKENSGGCILSSGFENRFRPEPGTIE